MGVIRHSYNFFLLLKKGPETKGINSDLEK